MAAWYAGQLFVGLSGPTYLLGTTPRGKKIQTFQLDANGQVESEALFLDYIGAGYATVIGVAFGLDGLYFTDLYGENGFDESGLAHGNVYRIRWLPGDTTAPVISAVHAIRVTGDSALIAWQTDELSDSKVEYGLDTSYGNSSPSDTGLVRQHSVALANLQPQTTYHYRVYSRDAGGHLARSNDFTFATTAGEDTTLLVDDFNTEHSRPRAFELSQNYPNPYHFNTSVRLALPEAAFAHAVIYDLAGREIQRLYLGQMPAGYHVVNWDGRGSAGRPVSGGVYFLRVNLETPASHKEVLTRQLRLIK
ncbi:MAG: FlgD immunoglobulin-like domain containing protein [bacterium]